MQSHHQPNIFNSNQLTIPLAFVWGRDINTPNAKANADNAIEILHTEIVTHDKAVIPNAQYTTCGSQFIEGVFDLIVQFPFENDNKMVSMRYNLANVLAEEYLFDVVSCAV